jgi:D-3-phosphoglycerate dehydrogenase
MPMPERVKIVVPGDFPTQIAGSPSLERLEPYGDLTLHATRPESSEEKIDRARDAEIIINSRSVVTWREAELRALPKLMMITTCSIGTDSIDLDVARELGIVVSNQPGRTAPAVAEHMFGLMFAVAKRAAFQTAVARLARAIGMEVIAWTFNPSPERAERLGVRFVERDDLLRGADVVSLHVKLTESTRHLIGARELALMKDDAILLNGARGDVVDMQALHQALMDGRFTGVGLDVFPREPLPADDPILECQQVVLTPHLADATPEAVELLNEGAVDNIIAFLEGRPQNNVAI